MVRGFRCTGIHQQINLTWELQARMIVQMRSNYCAECMAARGLCLVRALDLKREATIALMF
jgi:hypothetical protein